MASNMNPWLILQQQSLRSAGGDVLHHLGIKTERYTYQSFKFQVNHQVAPVVRPIHSVDMLISKKGASIDGSWSKQLVHFTA